MSLYLGGGKFANKGFSSLNHWFAFKQTVGELLAV